MSVQSISLHIGLNGVDPQHYNNWRGELFACENDAGVYKAIAEKANFQHIMSLLTTQATAQNVIAAIEEAGKTLGKGDIFFISYSGHGGSVPDTNGDEDDGLDETWCLYDRQLIDDELFTLFSGFAEGVRILVFSDSCYSGSIARAAEASVKQAIPEDGENYLRSRDMPMRTAIETYSANKATYDNIQKGNLKKPEDINAFVLQFGACQDCEVAMEALGNGLFTAKLKTAVQQDNKTYDDLLKAITQNFTPRQRPKTLAYGNVSYDFSTNRPFSITGVDPLPLNIFTEGNVAKEASGNTELIIEHGDESGKEGLRSRDVSVQGKIENSIRSERGGKFFTREIPLDGKSEWDCAYKTYLEDTSIKFVEPNVKSPYLKPEVNRALESNDYLKNWPAPVSSPTEFIWHLDDEHSQLRKAYDFVTDRLKEKATVRIGHIDTGYIPLHPSTPAKLLKDLGVSFFKNEFGSNKGIDQLNTGFPGEQDGHGCATLALLAGKEINSQDSYANYSGWFGAVPFAEVIPIRICDTVFNLFNANDVADGIDYAVNYGCEVITMSMAGYPTKRVAEAVNRAYENGVIVVTAAGNNFVNGVGKLAPKAVLYPARFERVIAATGACYNSEPYDLDANEYRSRMEGGEFMQGNWGPESAMKTSVAAYTPNVAWASLSKNYRFHRSGGGTSSATPQIAATAALWIAYNRDNIQNAGIDRTWKKVEAARSAIFSSAKKNYPAYRKYYGNGIIQAFNALDAFNFADVKNLQQSSPAKVKFTGFLEFASGWFRNRSRDNSAELPDSTDFSGLQEMVSLELLQLIHRDPALFTYAEILDFENDETAEYFKDQDTAKVFDEKVLASPFASDFLKNLIRNRAN